MGHRHGQGTMIEKDGTMYQGTWVENNKQGKGLCRYPNGTYYEGQWHANLYHGHGKETF